MTNNHASTPPLRVLNRPDALPAAQPTAPKPEGIVDDNNDNK